MLIPHFLEEILRTMRLIPTMTDAFLQDIRFAFRSMGRHKAFTLTAFLALALGIGTTTGIFTVVSSVILRPLPFVAPDRLVQLYGTPATRGQAISAADVEEFRRSAT